MKLREDLDTATAGEQDADSSIVAFGSVARFEVTDASDIDWVLLIDGQANLAHQRRAIQIGGKVDSLAGKKVGQEGTFGKMVFSHDVVQYIGGGDDTNANFTRRMLLLLESTPIGRRGAYDAVVRVILERYLTGDHGWALGRATHGVPRFLLTKRHRSLLADNCRRLRLQTVDSGQSRMGTSKCETATVSKAYICLGTALLLWLR